MSMLELAVRAVQSASVLCKSVQGKIDPGVLEKKDKSPVTLADFGSQALVARTLSSECPEIPLVAEEDAAALAGTAIEERVVAGVSEVLGSAASRDQVIEWINHGSGDASGERFWTLDPIDGTKGFLRGEQYAVALALIEGGVPTLAALACPNLGGGVIFTAERDSGARRIVSGQSETIRVSTTSVGAEARFVESVESGHTRHDHAQAIADRLKLAGESVRMDSQAKYGVLAAGDAEIYLRLPTRADYVERIWDHAAGALIVQEAGGRVTDVDGRDLDFGCGRGLERNRGVIATNGALHEAVLEAAARVGV